MAEWYKITISFRGAALDRRDALTKARELFDGMPLMNLEIDAALIPQKALLRMLDQERSKAMIESDTDQGVSLVEMIAGPVSIPHPWDEGLWIFPEGHPMRPYEESAKRGDESSQVVLDRELGKGGMYHGEVERRQQLALGGGSDSIPDDLSEGAEGAGSDRGGDPQNHGEGAESGEGCG